MFRLGAQVYPVLKRLFDIVISTIVIFIFFIPMLIIAMFVRIDTTGPVIYKGVRGGVGGRPFNMYKYRTMVMNADKIGGPSTAGDDPRVTKVGTFLRRYKLDELPQLFNVLKGDMSLVGPRPEVLSEVEKYTSEEMLLLSVRPGITDWASIVFNNEGEILKGATDPHQAYLEKIRPEKVRLGLEYVNKRSLIVDMQIIARTFTSLLNSRT
jgi:lipopolysaccharide/colanic/teichoic acid biosynthesis glycosyltransferase